MKNCIASMNETAPRPLMASVTALVLAFTVALPHAAHADRVTPPPVPTDIQVPAGNKAFLEGHAVGTQNYICLPSATGFAWILFGPQATLFTDDDKQVNTHFLSANPYEGGLLRATWQHSRDTSAVWAALDASSTDPMYVAPGAIAWLRLRVVGSQDGPTGHKLTATTFIQRLNTVGGLAPSTGCAVSTDVGRKAFVPYTADYFFFKAIGSDEDEDN